MSQKFQKNNLKDDLTRVAASDPSLKTLDLTASTRFLSLTSMQKDKAISLLGQGPSSNGTGLGGGNIARCAGSAAEPAPGIGHKLTTCAGGLAPAGAAIASVGAVKDQVVSDYADLAVAACRAAADGSNAWTAAVVKAHFAKADL